MSQFNTPSLDSDANHYRFSSNEAFRAESTWTFVTLTTGATGAHTVFTVTGNCLVQMGAICDTSLGGAATLEMGVAGNTAALLTQIADATTFDDGQVWGVDGSPAVGVEALGTQKLLNDGADIIMTIGSTAITSGALDIYCLWRPLSSDANLTVTTPA